MMKESPGMLNFHPVDESESTQHQVVTATGESFLLYGDERKPILVDEQSNDGLFSEDDSFPAKKVTLQKSGKDFIKPAKFKPAEIDVSSGNSNPTPELNLVSLKKNKKQKADEVEVIDLISDDDNTFENLNVNLRKDAWQEAIVKNGKITRGVHADGFLDIFDANHFGLLEDNFRDYDHLNSRLYDEFLRGFVVLGTKNAVSSLLNATSSLKMGTHGVIVDTSLPPSYDGLFEEGECLQYQMLKELGKGSFGTVSYCRHFEGQSYVKKVIAEKFNSKEVEVLMQLSHPNITAFRGYIFREGCHEIMMEYGGDSLKTVMEKNKADFQKVLTYNTVTNLALQGFSALEYMYDRFGILHLDIKPENICVQLDPPTLKFTDFGTSKTPQQAISFDGWTPEYMSPEACRLILAPKLGNLPEGFVEDLTGKADVFSFGLVVCFMLTGSHTVCKMWPPRFTPENSFAMWRSQYIVHLAMNPSFTQKLAIQDEWPKAMRDLVTSALEGSTAQRVNACEASTFIQQNMLTQVNMVNIPTLFSPDSPGAHPANDLPTVESICSQPPASPIDVSLQHCWPPGGGKDIKNQLRRKIRRNSAAPYRRQPSIAAKTEKIDNTVGALPVFAALGMDD